MTANKLEKGFYIWLGLTLLSAFGIFLSSSIEGGPSGAASMAVAEFVRRFIRLFIDIPPETLNFLVRKVGGHVGVYAVLGFCTANTLKYVVVKSRVFWMAWAIASAYGVVDEVYQYFVPDRVMAASDMLINAIGAFIGAGLAYMFFVRGRNIA